MTRAVQDYLKAIYVLTRSGAPASTKDMADRLGTSQPAISKMLKHLQDRGWVEHTPYRGVLLTDRGEMRALEMIRHHRLIERYLVDHLGFAKEDVHAEAERLEHHISEEFEDRIAELMGHPEMCPHGRPIPPKVPYGI